MKGYILSYKILGYEEGIETRIDDRVIRKLEDVEIRKQEIRDRYKPYNMLKGLIVNTVEIDPKYFKQRKSQKK